MDYKLLVWGTGTYAKQFVVNGYNGEIVGFIESNRTVSSYMQKPVYGAADIPKAGYDYIIVANSFATEIYRFCEALGIDLSKVIFLYGVKKRMGCVDSDIIQDILLEKNYTNYCAEFRLDSFVNADAQKYSALNTRENFKIENRYMWPILEDKYTYAGTVGNYFWQDLWAARLIINTGVKEHFDIGSRLDGFIAHLLAVDINVTMIDVREFPEQIDGLHTIVDDATSLRQIPDESVESMSALCSLEHFGLGRYGDPIDPEACFKCFENMQKKLMKGGHLYISVPIGMERLEFNAHRVFYAKTIIDCFSGLELEEFSCTADGKLESNVNIHKYDMDFHNGNYRYGLFAFVK